MNFFAQLRNISEQVDAALGELKSLQISQSNLAQEQKRESSAIQSIQQELSATKVDVQQLHSWLTGERSSSKQSQEEERLLFQQLQAGQDVLLKSQADYALRLDVFESRNKQLETELQPQRVANMESLLKELSLHMDDIASLVQTHSIPGDRPHPRLRVHFFFQVPEVWTTWESVWTACLQAAEVEPAVVLLPFQHGSHQLSRRERNFLAKRGIPFVDISAYTLEQETPDLVFLQNPYDSTRPPQFAMQELLAKNIRVAYIPYGLDVGGGEDNLRWQYDLEVQRHAWRVFVRSAQHQQMYGMHCQSGNRHVVVTGHPKLDLIGTDSSAGNIRNFPQSRRNVLWTPHFSLEPGGWSTFLALYEEVFSYFERHPEGISLSVRPHPLFWGRLKEVVSDASAFEQRFRERIAQSDLITLDENEQYAQTFKASDALMADAGSFLLEYLPSKKPILYLHNPQGPGLNESGDFVSHYYRAENFEGVQSFFEMVRRGEDPKLQNRVEQISNLLYCPDGNSGARIVDYIIKHLPPRRLQPRARTANRPSSEVSA